MKKDWRKHEAYDEYQYELGTECCGWDMRWENDGIGICGNCHEWAGYDEGDEKDFGEWLALNAQ